MNVRRGLLRIRVSSLHARTTAWIPERYSRTFPVAVNNVNECEQRHLIRGR